MPGTEGQQGATKLLPPQVSHSGGQIPRGSVKVRRASKEKNPGAGRSLGFREGFPTELTFELKTKG